MTKRMAEEPWACLRCGWPDGLREHADTDREREFGTLRGWETGVVLEERGKGNGRPARPAVDGDGIAGPLLYGVLGVHGAVAGRAVQFHLVGGGIHAADATTAVGVRPVRVAVA